MPKQRVENRRVNYSSHALEYTHNQLLLPQVQDNLGDTALTLLATIENVRVVPLTYKKKNRVLTLPGYEDTSIIPMVALKENETIRNEMYKPTPEQYAVVEALDADPSKPFGPALRENYYVPLNAVHYQFSDAYEAVTVTECSVQPRGDDVQKHTVTNMYRPLIILNYDLHGCDLSHLATTLTHEVSHVTDALQQPVTTGAEEDLSLDSELRAFNAQYEIARATLNLEGRKREPLAFAVEAIRRRINGPVHDNPYAFEPNQAMKDELEAQGLSYVYR